jgi:ABC-type thiamine transport system ATPase subunit
MIKKEMGIAVGNAGQSTYMNLVAGFGAVNIGAKQPKEL